MSSSISRSWGCKLGLAAVMLHVVGILAVCDAGQKRREMGMKNAGVRMEVGGEQGEKRGG